MKQPDKLEEALKKAYKDHEVDFRPTDWEAMRRLMRAQAGAKKLPWQKFGGIFLGTLLLVGLGLGICYKQPAASKSNPNPERERVVADKAAPESNLNLMVDTQPPRNEIKPKSKSRQVPALPSRQAPSALARPEANPVQALPNELPKPTVAANSTPDKPIAVLSENPNLSDQKSKQIAEYQSNSKKKLNQTPPHDPILKLNTQPIKTFPLCIAAPAEPFPSLPVKLNPAVRTWNLYGYTGMAAQANGLVNPYAGVQVKTQLHKVGIEAFGEFSSLRRFNPHSLNADILGPNNSGFAPAQTEDFSFLSNPSPGILIQERFLIRNLYYAGGGLGVSLPLKRHELGLSAYARYMFLTSGEKEVLTYQSPLTTATPNLDNAVLVATQLSKANNYFEGLNRLDWGLGLRYGYAVNRNLSLELAYIQGLRDISQNSYYQLPFVHRNQQLRVGVAFRLR